MTDRLDASVWDSVHDSVQQVLAAMDRPLQARVSGLRCDAGRTQARGYPLFTYRRYASADESIDPVMAGITVQQDGDEIELQGDVSGEALGDVLYAASPRTIAMTKDLVKTAFDVVQHACEMAQELCAAEDVIAKAVVDPSRVEPDELSER